MTNPSTARSGPGGRTFRGVLVTLLVLALLTAVAVLLSQLNARTYRLERLNGRLVVMKGLPLPYGFQPFQPADPSLADTYAPVELDGAAPVDAPGQRFLERDALDRSLFRTLESLARTRVQSDDPEVLERGLYYLRRAERLGGLSEEQRLSLKALQADVAYYQARAKMEDAQRLLTEATALLRTAAGTRNRHSNAANRLLSTVEPSLKALEDDIRRGLHLLTAPAPEPVAPAAPTDSGEPTAPAADAGTVEAPPAPEP